MVLQADDVLYWVTDLWMDEPVGDFIPIGQYNYTLFGLFFVSVYTALTYYYQRSFHYAVTSDAVIFEHSFLLSRAHRRILFDRISEVMVERTPVGTLLGFATVTILTDSGVGIVEENTGPGIAGAIPGTTEKEGDSTAEKASKVFFAQPSDCSPTREQFELCELTLNIACTTFETGKAPKLC